MLFIIFGWKTRTKDYGETYPAECPHCENDNYLHLLKARRWFRLYFIPAIPLSRASYDLVCPTCNASMELDTRAHASQAKDLATKTKHYHHGTLSDSDYRDEIAAFESTALNADDGSTIEIDTANYNGSHDSDQGLRILAALLFVVAILGTVSGALNANPLALVTALFMLPYLGLRYRDPASTTLPLAGYVTGEN